MIPTLPNGEPQKGQSSTSTSAPTDALRQLRSQSPQESLGLSGKSGLVKASIQAGIGFVIVFAALTVGPYFWEKTQASTKANAPDPAAKPETPAAQTPAPTTPDPAGKLPPSGATASGKQPGKGDIVDKLNENVTKTAPAKSNPLDKKEDDILKDFK